jgi:NADH:ubiquinone oxidoreductase subunit E/NAD-dependent dihydropyrimidine dehydrogenase PreA subunit
MCSDPGQDLIKNDIAGGLIDRVVVASCSPLMHEATFRGATASAGQNPYFMQMANIREHVSWVTADGGKATEKAKALIAGAVRRVVLHVALERKKVGVKSDVLVVGAGIAGIHAALTLANSGKKVYLVEREPSIGGHMAQFDKTFPTLDCSACILTPKMTDVRSHPNIKMMTYSEVQSVSGFIGNFEVEVRRKARYVDEDKCTGCGECTVNCPVRNRISPPEHLEIEPHLDHEVKTWLTNLLEQYKGRAREALLPIMIEVNRQYRYLPRDIIHYMAWRLDIPLSDVALQMATFYNVFSLKPRGLHTIRVCLGTACFVKGSGRLLERLERELGIKTGETTSDLNFTLEAVRCIGCCALAPALRIDGDTYAHVRQDRIPYLLKKYKVEGGVKV